MRRSSKILAPVLAVAALVLCADVEAQAFDDPPPPPETHPLRDGLGWRLGFINSGLFDSGQGRPFWYLDTGLRFKTDRHYVDLKLPAALAGLDYLSHEIQGSWLGIQEPFNLFEAANEPIHYGAYLEVAHLRIGQTWVLHPFDSEEAGGAPLRLTGGVAAFFDFVFFDLAVLNQDPENFDDIDNPEANDPFVLAAGAFVALGGDAPLSEYDIALGVAPDLFQDPSYVPNRGLVMYLDLDLQIDLLEDLSAYLRSRLSTYTHVTSPLILTMVVNYGIVLRLW